MAEVARLGGGILGGTLGFFIGGPLGASIGFSLGSMAGGLVASAIEGPQVFRNEGAIPPDISFSGSTQGTPIARVYGTGRVPGNIIQYRDRLERVTTRTRSSGGKGFGGGGAVTENVTYRRLADVMYAVCYGEAELYEIFRDGDRDYSQQTGANGGTLGNWRWYRGTETQVIDSQSQAIFGEQQSAYRGTAYWVTNEWDLSQYNNRLPNMSFVVTNNITYTKGNEEIPTLAVIPEGYTRPDGFVDAYANIRNKRDGSGFYYILKSAAGYHLAEYSHATRSAVNIGPAWQFYNPVGNRVWNTSFNTSEILTGEFAWGDEVALSRYEFDVDDAYIYIIADLVNATYTNFGPIDNHFLMAIRRDTGESFIARNSESNIAIRGTFCSVGFPSSGGFPPQATPNPILDQRVIWVGNRTGQASRKGRDSNVPTVMAFVLDPGRFNSGEPLFENVAHWRSSEIAAVSPISYYLRDVLGVMDPEFDLNDNAYYYYQIVLGSDNASAALIKYKIIAPFFPLYSPLFNYNDSFRDNPRASISGRGIVGMPSFLWADNQYDNMVTFDTANNNFLMWMGRNEAVGADTRPVLLLINEGSSSVIDVKTLGELKELTDYKAYGTSLYAQVFTDPIYDPGGYFWMYNSVGLEHPVRISTSNLDDITYYDPTDYANPGFSLSLDGRVSYDYLGNVIHMWNDPPGTDRVLLLGRGSANNPTLTGILEDLLRLAGLQPADYDVSELTGFPENSAPVEVTGYVINKPSTVWEAISQLATGYGFYMIESEGKLKFKSKYGRTPIQILSGDLGATEGGTEGLYEERSAQLSQLPSSVTLNYVDAGFDYQQGTQLAKRLTKPNNNNPKIDTPLVLTAKSARYIVDRLLFEEWQNRRVVSFAIPIRGESGTVYLGLEPGDVIAFNYSDTFNTQTGELFEVLEIKSQGLLLFITARGFEDAFYNTDSDIDYIDDVGIDITPQPTPIQYPPEWRFIDMVALRDGDREIGYYHASGSANKSASFLGLTLYQQIEQDFEVTDLVDQGAKMGNSLNILPQYPHFNFDLANTLDIQLNSTATIASYTEEQVLNGAGAVIIGTPTMGWELIQYQDATDLGEGKWRLSKLLRNRRGSEDCKPTSAHIAYSQVILLPTQNSGVRRTELSGGDIGELLSFKPVGTGFNLPSTPTKTATFNAISSKPRSPTNLSAERVGGNIVITWKRRDRLADGWDDLIDLPLTELSESYQIIVGADSFTSTSPTLTVSDTYSSPTTISVAQISATVGAGYASTISI